MYHGLKQKHGKIQGVSMLPFGLVAGFAGEKEIRIIELAENGFTFRTAEKIADPELFRVCFYHYPKLEYEQVELHSYTLECSGKYEFYYEYTLYLNNIGDMLDNMDDETMKKAIHMIDDRAETECSGNVTEERLKRIAELGVDYVSCGALTHSAPILDISLKGLHVI